MRVGRRGIREGVFSSNREEKEIGGGVVEESGGGGGRGRGKGKGSGKGKRGEGRGKGKGREGELVKNDGGGVCEKWIKLNKIIQI